MHECNAMQILETKKKKKKTKTKEQWSQRKSNEAQGPCQKDSVSLSLLHPKLFRCISSIGVCIHIRVISNSKIGIKVEHLYQFTNKCYRILCLRHWHFWLVCSLNSLQLVTVWTNVSRLPTKMTHPSRLTIHLVLRKGRHLRFGFFQINPNLPMRCNFYGFDSLTHNLTHRGFRRRWRNKVCEMGCRLWDAFYKT